VATESHYPHYNVLDAAEDWDPHTRQAVESRLAPLESVENFTTEETKNLYQIAAALVDDDRTEILDYVVKHFDNSMGKRIGESQRKTDVPAQADLIRRTLTGLAKTARDNYGKPFHELSIDEQRTILGQLERGQIPATGIWKNLPQKEAFSKLLSLTVEAYYSHPQIWSEIGHGGPAYPRGYIRTEPGLVDPWEAQSEE